MIDEQPYKNTAKEACEKLARDIEGIMAEVEHRPTTQELRNDVGEMLAASPWHKVKDTPEAREAVTHTQQFYLQKLKERDADIEELKKTISSQRMFMIGAFIVAGLLFWFR